VAKSREELEAIKRAFGKKDLPQPLGIRASTSHLSMTPAQRRAYEKQRQAAIARAALIS
jgi:hypothetical protein